MSELLVNIVCVVVLLIVVVGLIRWRWRVGQLHGLPSVPANRRELNDDDGDGDGGDDGAGDDGGDGGEA